MDELDTKLNAMLRSVETKPDYFGVTVDEIKQAFKDAGWVKLPGNAQNITITTSDNPNDKLMTREQWEAERG